MQIWDEVTPSDGIVRQFQWTARVEGDSRITNSSSKSSTPICSISQG